MNQAINQLRIESLSSCTRPFNARGSIVKRCTQCQLALFACLCPWRLIRTSNIHFILLMHRKELYKTTNTGQLIADLLPGSTSAYLWSRTEPDSLLLKKISDTSRRVVLLFPEPHGKLNKVPIKANEMTACHREKVDELPLTVILLDGTWKQASRMANLSDWLQDIERLPIKISHTLNGVNHTDLTLKENYIRKAQHEHQLSTAQAAACVLREYGDNENADLLEHYFSVFNQHCIATRRNITPTVTDSHRFLTQAKNNDSTN